MAEAYIIDAVRTPRGIGKQGKGALAHLHPQHLARTVLEALVERNGFDTADVDDVIWGTSAQQGPQSGDLGRMAALDAGAEVVGVNARNLDDFTVDLDRALELVARVPARCVAVAESAMTTRGDVERAAAAGADAVLIGGALASAADPEAQARELAGVARRGR